MLYKNNASISGAEAGCQGEVGVACSMAAAGLSAACKLMKLASEESLDISVCLIEKGSEIGAHILSGAVIDPIALNELIPDWKDRGAPLNVLVTDNQHWVLGEKKKKLLN